MGVIEDMDKFLRMKAAMAMENYNIAKQLVQISRERLERAQKKSAFGQAKHLQQL